MIFHGYTGRYERQGIFNREEVLPYIGSEREFNGDVLNLESSRYHLIKLSQTCVTCGIEGLYFAKERSIKRHTKFLSGGIKVVTFSLPRRKGEFPSWHLNLYALREDGTEVMMTKDHIVPASRGGPDKMWNFQMMCFLCNGRKGCTIPLAMSTYAGA
jgi:5-methylcytosine-specific restriction endonuclease McrA